MPRYKDADSEQIANLTRQKLLDAAAEEFARQGYNAANINNISLAAGFAKGTIYNYFPSKEALLLELIETAAADHIAFIAAAVREVQPPRERLLRFFQAGFAYVEAHPRPMQVIVHTLYGPDETFKTRLAESYRSLFAVMIEDILQPGMADGSFRPLSPAPTASLLLTTYLGMCIPQDPQGRIMFDPHTVADFMLNGLQPPRPDANHKETIV